MHMNQAAAVASFIRPVFTNVAEAGISTVEHFDGMSQTARGMADAGTVHTLQTLDGTVRQVKEFRRAFQLHEGFCSGINLRLSSKKME